MTINAIKGFGVKLGIGDGADPEVFTDIAELASDLTGPGLTRETFETTSHDSTGGYNTYGAGPKDLGEFSFEINYIPNEATHKDATGGLLNLFESGALTNFQLTFPDSVPTKWVIPVIVTGFEPVSRLKDKLGASVTLKGSGAPTLA